MLKRGTAEAGLDDAVAVEDEGRRCLQHVEVLGDVGTVGEVDVEVEHTFALLGDRAERAMHARAAAAHLGAELQQGGTVAQRLGTQPLRLDDLARVEVTGAVLLPPRVDAHADRHREQRGEDEDGIDRSHSLRV